MIEDLLHGLIAQTAETGDAAGPGLLLTVLPWIAIFAFFYLLILRPQAKQQRDQERIRAELKKGDDVVLSSGIFGKIAGVEEQAFVVEIAPNVRIRVLKSSVATSAPTASATSATATSGKAADAEKKA